MECKQPNHQQRKELSIIFLKEKISLCIRDQTCSTCYKLYKKHSKLSFIHSYRKYILHTVQYR